MLADAVSAHERSDGGAGAAAVFGAGGAAGFGAAAVAAGGGVVGTVRSITTAFPVRLLSGTWSTLRWSFAKCTGASRCVPPCSGAENAFEE